MIQLFIKVNYFPLGKLLLCLKIVFNIHIFIVLTLKYLNGFFQAIKYLTSVTIYYLHFKFTSNIGYICKKKAF